MLVEVSDAGLHSVRQTSLAASVLQAASFSFHGHFLQAEQQAVRMVELS